MLYRTNKETVNLSRVETFYKCKDSKNNDEYLIGLLSGREIRCAMTETEAASFLTYWSWNSITDENVVLKCQENLDRLGLAISDAGYVWTEAMRKAYDSGLVQTIV